METEDLCSVNIFPLVTNPFAVQWSPDNQISIITEKGVHILQLEPSPMSPNPTFKFARSFIYPSDTFPSCAFTNNPDSSAWNLIRQDIYSLLINDEILPKLNGVIEAFPRITQTSWSPKNLISPSQCVLAILSSTGAIELLYKVSNNWYSICDVSILRLKMIEDEIKVNFSGTYKNTNSQNVKIADSLRKLQACAMTWSPLFKIGETSFAYFSVAYCDGDILIWKVPRISNFTKSLELTIVNTINLNGVLKANVLCWVTINVHEHLIVVGYLDGRICGIKLTDNLQIAMIEKYVDPDRVAVNYLYIISQEESCIKILAAKGPFLLLLHTNLMGELKNMQHLHIEGFTITGITPIITQQFLVTTQNSYIFLVDTHSDDLITIDVKNFLPQNYVQYLGLAHSPSKIMFVNITSPSTVYDHLITREPSVMNIFTLKGAICDPLSVINKNTNLGSIWDCMEVLRLKAAKVNDPCTVLGPTSKKLESLSLYKLQVSMWMTVIMNVCTTKKPMLNMVHVRECKITEALPLIFLHSACAYLENSLKKDTMSENQKSAVFLLRRYLEIYRGTDEDTINGDMDQRIKKILNMTELYSNQIEKCNLCGEIIDELWHVKTCPQGHKLSRCCTTLLQIKLLEYRVCPICKQMFHPCLEDMYEEPQCQFCDVPILHNFFDFDAEDSELYIRNLSLPQIPDGTELSRDTELEEPPDKQKRSKWDTSHTYSVIVNDDDDESGRIMEKWEEF
ncbi:hypothetical protein PUN28_014652 [Cardiocondyla obscurior]|uniref:Transcription factor IIIC 90kDa subunit N-terminal domain-containing protein n=1 Tax=Cardiocondyla obscurior TaxID=286306 RepID=A0AAW2F0R8_9HYME